MPEDPDPAVDLLLRHGTLPCLCDRCWPRDSFRDLPPEDFALAKRLDNERVARQGF